MHFGCCTRMHFHIHIYFNYSFFSVELHLFPFSYKLYFINYFAFDKSPQIGTVSALKTLETKLIALLVQIFILERLINDPMLVYEPKFLFCFAWKNSISFPHNFNFLSNPEKLHAFRFSGNKLKLQTSFGKERGIMLRIYPIISIGSNRKSH